MTGQVFSAVIAVFDIQTVQSRILHIFKTVGAKTSAITHIPYMVKTLAVNINVKAPAAAFAVLDFAGKSPVTFGAYIQGTSSSWYQNEEYMFIVLLLILLFSNLPE